MTEIRKVGQPTKYTFEMCAKVKESGNKGWHVSQMANALDVVPRTIYGWAKVYPEFAQAFELAKQASLCFWYKLGEDNLNSKHFNERTYELLLRNKCNLGAERRVKVKGLLDAKTHTESGMAVIQSMAAGDISPTETQTIMNSLTMLAKLDEVTELRKIVERLEKEDPPRNPPELRVLSD